MNTPSSQAVTTLMQQAALNLRVGQHDAARKCYLDVLTLVPDHADAMANLSKLAMHEGRPDEALSWLEKVILQIPSSSLHLEMGRQYQILNQLEDAIRHARAAIDLSPQNIIAYELLGDACFALDRLPEAVAAFRQALELSPRDAALHGKLGCVFFQLQDADNAIASLSQAISLQPDLANAYLNRGTIYLNLGQSALGLADMESAIRHDPSLIDAHLNIAMEMHAQNRRAESAAALRRVIALDPQNAFAFNGLANQLHALNENSEAEACFRQATTLNPEYTEAFCDWGDHLLSLDRNAEAAACYQRALALEPDHIRANFHLGMSLQDLNKLNEAVKQYLTVLQLDPTLAMAHVRLGSTYHELGRYAEERAEFRRAIQLDPTCLPAHTSLLFALNDVSETTAEDYLKDARAFGEILRGMTSPYQEWKALTNWTSGQALRVGFVSGDMRLHPVGYFLEGLMRHLDTGRVESFAYNIIRGFDDELTERLKHLFTHWRSLPTLEINDEEAARQIHGDNLHILIDLSGHTRFNRLATFAMRPAPVQISWLGYFASTGVPGMDYLIADPVSVPEAHRAHFTEEILYLPDTRLCFTPQPVALTLEPASAPVLDNGYITFGCFQNLRKLNDRVLALWSRVLAEVPGSRMLFKNKQIEVEATRQTFLKRLADAGIARERIVMEGQSDYKDYLEAYGDVDLVLDTLPFPGGTTTCEALWMGVPTVTLAGDRMIGLQGASMLSCVGLHDWIAHSEDEFVAIAVAKAADSAGLAALRGELRQRMASSALVDAQRFARQFEVLLDEVWQRRLAAG